MGFATDSEPGDRLSDCVTALLREQPFFGSLALRLPLVPDPSRKTLASEGQSVRYNPDWVKSTGADLIQTALGRVVLACALKHHTRRGERQPERWQRASQLVTHGLLRDAGFTLPADADAWDGLSVEQAYERLPEPDGEGDGAPDGPGAGISGTDATSGKTGTPPPDGRDQPDGKPLNPAAPQPSIDPASTGEIMDAAARSSTAPGSDATDDDRDGHPSGPSPLSESDIAAEEQAWDEAMHQAANVARAQGNVPGAVEQTLQNAHRSRLDWRSLLRRYMPDSAENDYTWSFPNRRFIDSGLYLPSVRSEGMDAIALIVDSSGSVLIPALQRTWTEIRAIAQELRPERIFVLQVDTALQRVDEYGPDELPESLTVKGRGGTDFRPGIEWLEQQGVRLACCLYFTDMECSRYPDHEPDFPVIWINSGESPSDRYREPWGERIDLR